MSTKIVTLSGKKEIPMGNRSEYIEKELHVTRFYGGTERGMSIQLTLGHDYIQLDNETARRLIYELQNALNTGA